MPIPEKKSLRPSSAGPQLWVNLPQMPPSLLSTPGAQEWNAELQKFWRSFKAATSDQFLGTQNLQQALSKFLGRIAVVDSQGNLTLNSLLVVNGQQLGTIAENASVPPLNNIGDFASAPNPADYPTNSVYRNTTDGNTYVRTPISTWALFLEAGETGPAGPTGATGATGADGQRGSKSFYGTNGSWSDSVADAVITGAGFTKVPLDQVTLSNGSSFAETRFWSGTEWLVIAAVINGNLLVNGTVGAAALVAQSITASQINPTFGVLDIGSGTIRFDNGTVWLVEGTGFGSSDQFVMWFGPAQSSISACTEANAIFYLKTNGDAYFGGSLSAGTLQNSASSSDLSATAEVTVGPFGTNGNDKLVTLSYAWQSSGWFDTDPPAQPRRPSSFTARSAQAQKRLLPPSMPPGQRPLSMSRSLRLPAGSTTARSAVR